MRQFIALLISVIIIPLSVILILSWTFFSLINSPDWLKSAAEKQDIYSQIADSAIPSVIPDNTAINFSDQEKSRIAQAALPSATIQTNLNESLDKLYSWIKGGDRFQVNLDLSQSKLDAQAEISAILKERYAKLPECTSANLVPSSKQKTDAFPTCRIPAESSYSSRFSTFDPNEFSKDNYSNLPENLTLSIPKSLNNLPVSYRFLNFGLIILTIIDAILFILLILLFRRRPRVALRHPAVLLIFIALITSIAIYFGSSLFQQEIAINVKEFSLNLSSNLQTNINQIILSFVSEIKRITHMITLVFLGLGILSLIYSFFLPKQTSKNSKL